MAWIIFPILSLVIIIIIVAVFSDKNKNRNDTTHKDRFIEPITDRRGKQGEKIVCDYLNDIIADEGGYLLTNVRIPHSNGFVTEIDAVLITNKGLFCIEIKNWVGQIIGDDYSESWTQIYDDEYLSNKTHKNPVKQNQKHVNTLEYTLRHKFDAYNVVIFKQLEYRNKLNSNYTYTLMEFLNYYKSLAEYRLNDDEIKEIYYKLIKYC